MAVTLDTEMNGTQAVYVLSSWVPMLRIEWKEIWIWGEWKKLAEGLMLGRNIRVLKTSR